MASAELPPDEAHLYLVETDAVDRAELAWVARELLSEPERARHDRFLFERVRLEYLATRGLVRTVLSRYADVEAAAWTFAANQHGCPSIAEPAAHAAIRFNLSNTAGMIACLVSRARDVGVDVEDTQRRGETLRVANRFFSEREVADLFALPESDRRRRFFDYWTLKEAYIKARGMGLAIPLGGFSFALPEGGPIAIAIEPELRDEAASWQFFQHLPTQRHVVSGAIRRGDGPDVRVAIVRVDRFRPAP